MEEIFSSLLIGGNIFAIEAILNSDDNELEENIPVISTIFTVTGVDTTLIGKEIILPEIYKRTSETSAYVESLNDEELATLSEVLESKNFEIEKDNKKTLTKKF